jgi:hypothetical protein
MRKNLRRVFAAAIILTGPAFTACQAVLDFDRSPLQPYFEAGPPAEDTGTGGGGSDAGPDRASPSDGGDTDTGAETGPVDAGGDVKSDADT